MNSQLWTVLVLLGYAPLIAFAAFMVWYSLIRSPDKEP